MKASDIVDLVKLRLAVGLLGEGEQANWWPSKWFESTAQAFLEPIFGQRVAPARYHGVLEAARRVHDGRIGVGRAFHLFRLPEGLELQLHEAVVIEGASLGDVATPEAAHAVLAALSRGVPEPGPGPIRVGSPQDLQGRQWIPLLAGYYRAAISSSTQVFPYFAERQ